jgi:hypothetical protein
LLDGGEGEVAISHVRHITSHFTNELRPPATGAGTGG